MTNKASHSAMTRLHMSRMMHLAVFAVFGLYGLFRLFIWVLTAVAA